MNTQSHDVNQAYFYVYLHRRATDGKIFYVGKGSSKRAWEKSKRNQHWQNIVQKNGYEIEIVQDNMLEQFAFELEKNLIAFYGKENLCNMTDGGEGSSGAIRSEKTRQKLSEAHKKFCFVNPMLGKKHTSETKEKQRLKKIDKYVGTKHPRCSVTVNEVLSVKKLRFTNNMTCKEISKQLGISFHVVRNIVYKKSWGHVCENS